MPTFCVREPGVAYTGTSLYLPKEGRNVRAIKNALEFEVTIGGEQEWLYLWEETPNHIVVPRAFLTDTQFANLRCPVQDLTPKDFPKVDFHSHVVPDLLWPDKTIQRDALATWEKDARGKGGILNLACGKGKTVVAIECFARLGMPVLVIVGQTTIMNQWKERILGNEKTGEAPMLPWDPTYSRT